MPPCPQKSLHVWPYPTLDLPLSHRDTPLCLSEEKCTVTVIYKYPSRLCERSKPKI